MKKNLFFRLCLMMAAVLSTFSCRQDLLPEQETYHNTSAFQLTSKRISLNESKHKGKLVSEIKRVEDKLKTFSDTDTQGKIVNYGNGVSIDTESVIYIENGPNYHTYTFHITKANAPANAPVENLVLTPLPDGTYKELLVTYTLTPAEKLQAENGVAINTHGKAQITELAKDTYNNVNLQGKTITGVTCGWTEEVQFTVCDGNDHHSNGEATDDMGGPCHADNPSLPYLVAVYKCNWIYGTDPFSSSGPGVPVDQPIGAPGAGAPISGTCPDNGILTAPIDPTTSTNMECESGVPTQPNIPTRNTPCKQLSALKDIVGFTDKMTTLKANIETGTMEKGFILHDDAATPTSNVIEGGSPYDPADVNFEPYYENLYQSNKPLLYKGYGSVHAHLKNNPNHIGVPTPEDFNQLVTSGLLETSPENVNQKPTPQKAVMLVTTKIGLFAIKINDFTKMKTYISKYMLMSMKDKDKYIKDNFLSPEKYNILPTSTHDQQVTGFLRFLQDEEVGADMYEGNPTNNGDWKKLNLVDNGNGTYNYTQTPCNL